MRPRFWLFIASFLFLGVVVGRVLGRERCITPQCLADAGREAGCVYAVSGVVSGNPDDGFKVVAFLVETKSTVILQEVTREYACRADELSRQVQDEVDMVVARLFENTAHWSFQRVVVVDLVGEALDSFERRRVTQQFLDAVTRRGLEAIRAPSRRSFPIWFTGGLGMGTFSQHSSSTYYQWDFWQDHVFVRTSTPRIVAAGGEISTRGPFPYSAVSLRVSYLSELSFFSSPRPVERVMELGALQSHPFFKGDYQITLAFGVGFIHSTLRGNPVSNGSNDPCDAFFCSRQYERRTLIAVGIPFKVGLSWHWRRIDTRLGCQVIANVNKNNSICALLASATFPGDSSYEYGANDLSNRD